MGLTYKAYLRNAKDKLDKVSQTKEPQLTEEMITDIFETAHALIREPWEAQLKRRISKSGPHANGELLRLWENKKRLYERWKWRLNVANKHKYKES